MKVTDYLEQLSDIGKSTRDQQTEISVSEVWHIWNTLIQRYDLIESIQLFINYAKDNDLKSMLSSLMKVIKTQVHHTEDQAVKYGIPLPAKPPETVTSTTNIEEVTDKYIFATILRGIQGFLTLHLTGFTESHHPEIRESFNKKLRAEIDLYEKWQDYGRSKGWTPIPPNYRN